LAGYIVFGEPLALSWWVGATLIITGTLILTRANSKMEETKSKTD
jgi:multidrug transporter EmrE-like cation transporter